MPFSTHQKSIKYRVMMSKKDLKDTVNFMTHWVMVLVLGITILVIQWKNIVLGITILVIQWKNIVLGITILVIQWKYIVLGITILVIQRKCINFFLLFFSLHKTTNWVLVYKLMLSKDASNRIIISMLSLGWQRE